jgi:hypothetical protein
MKIYSVDIPVWASVYIKAENEEEAKQKLLTVAGLCINEHDGESEVEVSNLRFDDPDLPEISLSPAMTIAPLDQIAKCQINEVEEIDG